MVKVQVFIEEQRCWITVALFTSPVAAQRDKENRLAFALVAIPVRVVTD